MLNERFGFISFWLVQVGFNVTFMGMFAVGLAGQPRRVVTYPQLFATANFISTIGAYVIGIGMLFLMYAVISSWRHGELAPSNPWGSKTLEWTVPNPIPLENFEVLPVVTMDAYGYGEEPFVPIEEPQRHHELEPVNVGSSADEEGIEGGRP
jgi:cytochrome c oxidase subunit I